MFKNRFLDLIKKYFPEFALIFISVFLAFWLNEWSNKKGDEVSEQKLISEIHNGILADQIDLTNNIQGHKISLISIQKMRDWLLGKEITQDSIDIYYYVLFRNYTPIINKTGYESLKSNGLKTLTDDSLRFETIKLYEYYYKIIEKLEDNVEEMQDFKNFFSKSNTIISPYLTFDEAGKLVALKQNHSIPEEEINELMSYLWRMEKNKQLKMNRYNRVLTAIESIKQKIEKVQSK